MSNNNPFANVKATEAAVEGALSKAAAFVTAETPIVKADIATIKADVSQAAVVAKADLTKVKAALSTAKTDVVVTQSKLAAFIKNNAGKIATSLLVAGGLVIWHFLK
jgi:hypothetical protein